MTDSTTIPRGIRRDPSSAATPSPTRPDPVTDSLLPATAVHYVDIDRLAARIAANQIEQLDQLSLIGYPAFTDPAHRACAEVSLRITARRLIEEALGV